MNRILRVIADESGYMPFVGSTPTLLNEYLFIHRFKWWAECW